MRVLVTGGTGFVGSALCEHYQREGHSVIAFGKIVTGAEERTAERLRADGVEIHIGDMSSREDLAAALEGVAVVHHLAAAMREADKGIDYYREVNVEGTRRLLEESQKAGVARFVHCSSVGVYGDISGRVVDERSECRPANLYGITKLEAETVVRDFVAKEGAAVVIVRPAEVYGPGDARLLKLFRMIQKGKFILFGKGAGKHHMIHVDDVVGAFVQAAERPDLAGETFILAGPETISLKDLLALIAEILGVAPPKLRLPLAPMGVLAALVEGVCRPLGVEPPIYRRRLDFFRHDWHFDTSAMRETLGYTPRYNLRAGLERTIKGYRERDLLATA